MAAKQLWWVLLLCWLVNPSAWGWSADGHGDIAIAALEQLPAPTQRAWQQVLAEGPWAKRNASWRSHAARAAAWPDRVRSVPLNRLFDQYGSGKVPDALRSYRRLPTSDWHYTNTLFMDANGQLVKAGAAKNSGATCPPAPGGRLLEVWPKLFVAYEAAQDPRDKAIILAFVLHFVGDAYQPLHLLSSLDARCRHDRGGNAFCITPSPGFKAGLRCRDNLHFLWDQGFGAFKEKLTPAQHFRGEARDLAAAVNAVRRIAAQVYPAEPQQVESATYQSRSRRQVAELAPLASAHLAAALKSLNP